MEEFRKIIVGGALLERDGKFLLIKESHGPAVGKWSIPAGRWEDKESIIECAEREVKEEAGFDFKARNVLGVYSRHIEGQRVSSVGIIFIGDLGTQGAAKDSEITRWFTEEEIFQLDASTLRIPAIKEFIKDYKNGVKYPLEMIKL